jgi:hypothetical protein
MNPGRRVSGSDPCGVVLAEDKPKYVLCTRHKRQHRKSIEVCHVCAHRSDCRAYQKCRPSSFEDTLLRMERVVVDGSPSPAKIAVFKKELLRIKKSIDKYN